MKRLLCFILILLLLIPSALADEQKGIFRVESVNGNVGDTVTVIGAVENAPTCASFRVVMTYDSAVLKPEKVKKLDCDGLFMSNVNFTYQGKSAVNVLSADTDKSFEGNMQLFSVTFTILAESPESNGSPINVVYKEFFDPSIPKPQPIQLTIENGRVYVGDDTPEAPSTGGNDGSTEEGNTGSDEGSTTPSNPGNTDSSTEGNTGSNEGGTTPSNPGNTDSSTEGNTGSNEGGTTPSNPDDTDSSTEGNTGSNEGSTTPSNPGNTDSSTEGNTGSSTGDGNADSSTDSNPGTAGDNDTTVSNPTDTPADGTTDTPADGTTDTPVDGSTDTPADGNPEIAPSDPEDTTTPETEKAPADEPETEEDSKKPTGSWVVDTETEDIYHIDEEGEETVFVPEYTEKPEPGKVTEVILKDKETGKEAGSIKVEGNEDGSFEVIEQDVPSLKEDADLSDNTTGSNDDRSKGLSIWVWVGIGGGVLLLAGFAVWAFFTYRKIK